MNNPQPISMASIMAELQRFSQEKLSGNMTILAENRQMVRISLRDGKIVALSCSSKRGAEALPLILKLSPNWFQFIKGASSTTTDPDLPPTPDILNFLTSGASTSIPAGSGPAINSPIEVLPQQTIAVLKEILIEFMGPVAPMICNKILQRAQNLDSAIDLLAQEIPDRQQALKFKNKVKQKLS